MMGYSLQAVTFAKAMFLAFLAVVLALASESALAFAVAVVSTGALGLLDLYGLVKRPQTIRLSYALGVSILLAYGLGSAIYLATNASIDATLYQYWAPQGLFFDQDGLSTSLAACLFAASALYIGSGFERASYERSWAGALADPRAERLVWFAAAVMVFAIYSGEFGFMGAALSDSRRVSPLGTIAVLIIPSMVPYTMLLLVGDRTTAKRLLLLGCLLLFIGALFFLGRRFLLYALILSVIAWHMQPLRLTRNPLAGALVVLCALALIYWGFTFFLAMRIATYDLGRDAGLFNLMAAAWSQLGSPQAAMVQERLIENVGSRPFILSYFAGLFGAESNDMPLGGAELLYSFQVSIPSAFMPSKVGSLPPAPEFITHPLYGIPIFDGPNSPLVVGFDDFGLLGAIVYPLLMVALYRYFFRGVQAVFRNRALDMFVLFSILFQIFYIEQGFSTIFVTIRNVVIVVLIGWALMKFPVVTGGSSGRLQIRWRAKPVR